MVRSDQFAQSDIEKGPRVLSDSRSHEFHTPTTEAMSFLISTLLK